LTDFFKTDWPKAIQANKNRPKLMEHDAMYQANEQMCFRCGAIRRLTDPIQPGEKMPHWRLGGEKMPHCPEGGSNANRDD